MDFEGERQCFDGLDRIVEIIIHKIHFFLFVKRREKEEEVTRIFSSSIALFSSAIFASYSTSNFVSITSTPLNNDADAKPPLPPLPLPRPPRPRPLPPSGPDVGCIITERDEKSREEVRQTGEAAMRKGFLLQGKGRTGTLLLSRVNRNESCNCGNCSQLRMRPT